MLQSYLDLSSYCYKVIFAYCQVHIKRGMKFPDIENDPTYINKLLDGRLENIIEDALRRRDCIESHCKANSWSGYIVRTEHINLFVRAVILFRLVECTDLTPYLVEPTENDSIALKLIKSIASELQKNITLPGNQDRGEQIIRKWQYVNEEATRFFEGVISLFNCAKDKSKTVLFLGSDAVLNGYNFGSWIPSKEGQNTKQPTEFGKCVIEQLFKAGNIYLARVNSNQGTSYFSLLEKITDRKSSEELSDYQNKLLKTEKAQMKIKFSLFEDKAKAFEIMMLKSKVGELETKNADLEKKLDAFELRMRMLELLSFKPIDETTKPTSPKLSPR